MGEKEYLKLLFLQADDAVSFLTNERKWERECWVCNKFLSALNLDFSPSDFLQPISQPPDVIYKDARFEVYGVDDRNRKIHAEWKEERIRRKNAKRLSCLLKPYKPPNKIAPQQIIEFMKPALLKKKTKYGRRKIDLSKLDILAYINLNNYFLDLASPFPDMTDLKKQGWRSLSLFGNNYASVLFAKRSAPTFLRCNIGEIFTIDNL